MDLFGEDDDRSGQAFARARELRTLRDQLVAQTRSGQLTLPALFDLVQTDSRIGTIKAVVLLEALPGVGKVAARRALSGAQLDENIRVGRIGAGARETLGAALTRSAEKRA